MSLQGVRSIRTVSGGRNPVRRLVAEPKAVTVGAKSGMEEYPLEGTTLVSNVDREHEI